MTADCSVCLLVLCAAAAVPLARGQNAGSSDSNSGPAIVRPNPNLTTTTTPQPVFLSGRVQADDGQPLPELAKIERVCNGVPHAEGYADASGNFSIQMRSESGTFQDASENGGFASTGMGSLGTQGGQPGTNSSQSGNVRRFQNCELRATLSGFRSQSVSLAYRRTTDSPDVGTILVHRTGPDEGGTLVSARSLAAPKEAKKAFEKGMKAIQKRSDLEARTYFEKAVEAYPVYAEALCELGKLQIRGGQPGIARAFLARASQSDPQYVEPYLQLSLLAFQEGKWTELAGLTDKAVKLDPIDYPQLFLFNAVANFSLHRYSEAEQSIRQAERLDAGYRFPQIAHLYAAILAQRHEYTAAAERLRLYLRLAPDAGDAGDASAQLAEIERQTARSAEGRP